MWDYSGNVVPAQERYSADINESTPKLLFSTGIISLVEAGTAKQLVYTCIDRVKIRFGNGMPCDKNQIIPVMQIRNPHAHGFAHPPAYAVARDGVANFFGNGKTDFQTAAGRTRPCQRH